MRGRKGSTQVFLVQTIQKEGARGQLLGIIMVKKKKSASVREVTEEKQGTGIWKSSALLVTKQEGGRACCCI